MQRSQCSDPFFVHSFLNTIWKRKTRASIKIKKIISQHSRRHFLFYFRISIIHNVCAWFKNVAITVGDGFSSLCFCLFATQTLCMQIHFKIHQVDKARHEWDEWWCNLAARSKWCQHDGQEQRDSVPTERVHYCSPDPMPLILSLVGTTALVRCEIWKNNQNKTSENVVLRKPNKQGKKPSDLKSIPSPQKCFQRGCSNHAALHQRCQVSQLIIVSTSKTSSWNRNSS